MGTTELVDFRVRKTLYFIKICSLEIKVIDLELL